MSPLQLTLSTRKLRFFPDFPFPFTFFILSVEYSALQNGVKTFLRGIELSREINSAMYVLVAECPVAIFYESFNTVNRLECNTGGQINVRFMYVLVTE